MKKGCILFMMVAVLFCNTVGLAAQTPEKLIYISTPWGAPSQDSWRNLLTPE